MRPVTRQILIDFQRVNILRELVLQKWNQRTINVLQIRRQFSDVDRNTPILDHRFQPTVVIDGIVLFGLLDQMPQKD